MIVAALYNSAFPFSYEEVCILGKYLHVQDQVTRKLLEEKLSEIYGFNKAISNAIDYSIPTLVEADFILRPTAGIYVKASLNPNTPITPAVYKESFFLNNPPSLPSYLQWTKKYLLLKRRETNTPPSSKA